MAISRCGKQQQEPLLNSPAPPTATNGGGAAGRRRFLAFLALAVASSRRPRPRATTRSSSPSAPTPPRPPTSAPTSRAPRPTRQPPSMCARRSPPSPSPRASSLTRCCSPTPSTTPSPSPRRPASPPRPFSLVQETYPGDPYAETATEVIPTYFAYSGSGSVAAEVVYANYGYNEDYAYVAGKVALVRYGDIHCEDMVRNARAAAAIVYTDAKDFGGGAAKGAKRKWFPDGRWLPPTGVQVGTLYYGNGDQGRLCILEGLDTSILWVLKERTSGNGTASRSWIKSIANCD